MKLVQRIGDGAFLMGEIVECGVADGDIENTSDTISSADSRDLTIDLAKSSKGVYKVVNNSLYAFWSSKRAILDCKYFMPSAVM